MINLGWHRARRKGQAVVELAVAAPLLALMLFGLIDFGRAYFQYIALVEAAREGARYATYGFSNLSNAASPAQDTIQGRIKLADGGLNIPNNASNRKHAAVFLKRPVFIIFASMFNSAE